MFRDQRSAANVMTQKSTWTKTCYAFDFPWSLAIHELPLATRLPTPCQTSSRLGAAIYTVTQLSTPAPSLSPSPFSLLDYVDCTSPWLGGQVIALSESNGDQLLCNLRQYDCVCKHSSLASNFFDVGSWDMLYHSAEEALSEVVGRVSTTLFEVWDRYRNSNPKTQQDARIPPSFKLCTDHRDFIRHNLHSDSMDSWNLGSFKCQDHNALGHRERDDSWLSSFIRSVTPCRHILASDLAKAVTYRREFCKSSKQPNLGQSYQLSDRSKV
ncbi:hypothetical protein BKA63DRAFT_173941 [Paraphoma chrysanthemicola]|nr:hypothetical protein BKA63DRAFT_173941 [Paraphoma chrysanthemicola]